MICKATRLSAWAFALLWAALACAELQAAPSDSEQSRQVAQAANRVIVRFVPGSSESQRRRVQAAAAAVHTSSLPLISAEVWTVLGDPHVEAARISREPGVDYAEPDYEWRADRLPNDPEFPSQWALHNTGQTQGAADADIDAPEGWDLSTGRPIVLGIIDTGIDSAHPDLSANLWANPGEIPGNGEDDDGNGFVDDVRGWDFVEWDNRPFDQNGHGTHVAGIAAAVGNNGMGIAGVHWSAQVVALRFLNADGIGFTSAAVQALQYATRMHIPITCNSWGGAPYSQALRDAISAAADSGMLFVAAAGNFGKNTDVTPHYPASYDHDAILSVAATNHADRLAHELLWRSNFGLHSVDLAAPGVEILSTWPGVQYRRLSGTSMATPHVAGAAALVWSEHPELSALQVKSRLLATTDPLPDLTTTTVSGGRLNLSRALAQPDSTMPEAVTDLSVDRAEGTRVHLAFTSPGDDGLEGAAQRYIVRFALGPLGTTAPDSVVEWVSTVSTEEGGLGAVVVVDGLLYGTTYYFEVLAEDDWFNRSPAGNEVMVTTLGPPVVALPDSVNVISLSAGTDTVSHIALGNSGPGELFFSTFVEYPHDRGLAASLPADTLDLLLIYADNGAQALQDQLSAFADVGRVDVWHAAAGTGDIPRFRDVRGYDVVLAWNNRAWADPFEIGGLLAECIDSGISVVTLVDCWGTGSFASLGRYFQQTGYSPFVSTGEALFEFRTLGEVVAHHPIMKGVDDLAIASYHNQVRLTDGARPVAWWNDGTPLVATFPGSVAINVWPGDGYHWLGDFPRLVHNAVRYAAGLDSWLDVSPVRGEVPPGDSLPLELRVNAQRLVAGDYDAYVRLSSSDPLTPEVERVVHLTVSGSARIANLPDLLEVPDAFLGFEDTVYLTLSNVGTAPLVVSSPTFDVSWFHTPKDSLVVPPGEIDSLPILFTPPAVGEIWCNLDLTTSDPLRASLRVVLHALTALPPSLSVSDTVATAALYSGDQGVDTLRVVNQGEGTLHFHTGLRGSGSPTGASGAAAGGPSASDSIPVLVWARYADLSPGQEFEKLKQALSEFGTPASLLVTTTSDPVALENLLFDRQMCIVLEQENAFPDLSVIGASFSPVLNEFVTGGGTMLFLMEWGAGSGFAASTGLLDLRPVARASQVLLEKVVPDHALLFGLSDTLVGANLTAWYDVLTPGVETIVSDTSGRYAVVASRGLGSGSVLFFGFDFFSYNQDLARLLNNAVHLSRQNLAWLDVVPDSGRVEAGESLDFVVRCDAQGLDGGAYRAAIVLQSNDPVAPRQSIGVRLSVTDGPHLSPIAPVNFDTVFADRDAERFLTLHNSGNRTLRVDSLGTPPNGFEWDVSALEIEPRSDHVHSVRFRSGELGVHGQWLRLYTNDPLGGRDSAFVSAQVALAPRLAMSPDTLFAQVSEGGSETVAWTLRNDGGSVLNVQLNAHYDGHDPAPGTAWAPQAPLPVARSQAGVVALDDGRVYVVGGVGTARNTLASMVRFDPATGSWEARAPMPQGDFGMAVAHDRNGRLYAFGATNAGSYRYDPGTDSWEQIEDMPTMRVLEARAALGSDGLIYVTGGEGDGPEDALSLVQVYHPDENYWTLAPSLLTPRYGHAAVTGPDGRLYVIGGRTGLFAPPLSTVEAYDPTTRTWSQCADRPQPAYQFAACLQRDSRILTAGGKYAYEYGLGPFASEVWVYDPRSDTWLPGAPLPKAIGACAAAEAGGFLRVMGGVDSTARADQWVLPTPAWLERAFQSVSIPAGDSFSIEIPIDATGLSPGLHHGSASLASNDPDSPRVAKRVDLTVTQAPGLWLIDTTLEFGEVIVGAEDSLELCVANVGTASLGITLVSSQPGVFLSPGSVTLPGKESGRILVRFAPDAPGPVDGRLDLYSDDPHRPFASISMSGRGQAAGALEVDTTALHLNPGQLADTSVTLLLRNAGSGPLHWSVTGADAPLVNPAGALTRSVASKSSPAALEYRRRLSGVVVAASDARYNPVYTVMLEDLRARDAIVVDFARPFTAAWLDSVDVLILDDYVGNLFPDDLERVRDWVVRGGRLLLQNLRLQGLPRCEVLLAGSGITLYSQSLRFGTYSRFSGRAAAWGLDTIEVGPTWLWCEAATPAEVLVEDDFGRAVSAAAPWGAGRVAVTCSGILDNEYATRADGLAFVGRLIDWLAVGTPLVADPVAGTIGPGDVAQVTVRSASRPLAQGVYEERLTLHTDDPVHAESDIPVTLTVAGRPELQVATDTLWIDTTFVGYATVAELELSNTGTAPVEIQHAHTLPEPFSTVDTAVTVPALGSLRIPVRFTPPEAGAYLGWLILNTNDPQLPTRAVALVAHALVPPVFAAGGSALDMTLNAGDSGTATVSLHNQGESDLLLSVHLMPDTATIRPHRRLLMRPEGAVAPAGGERKGVPRARAAEFTHRGDKIGFGISDRGEAFGFEYPGDTSQLWGSGTTLVYRQRQVDYIKTSLQFFEEILLDSLVVEQADSSQAVVMYYAHTNDGRVGLERRFSFEHHRKYVALQTRIVNRSADTLEDFIYKYYADWDLDGTWLDSWDYDTLRQMPYGWDRHYAGLASLERPDLMDLDGRQSVGSRPTQVAYPSGPLLAHDGYPLLHFDLGDLPPGGSVVLHTVLAVGDSLPDLQREIDRGLQPVKWLDADVRAAKLAPGERADLTLHFTAAELFAGEYRAQLQVRSNDPATPQTSLPVRLKVLGAPAAAVDREVLDFGPVQIGYPRAEDVLVSNTGSDTLRILDVSADLAGVETAWNRAVLPPLCDTVLRVTLSPRDTGLVSGRLVFVHNDTLQMPIEIALHAQAQWPPTLAVSQDTQSVTLGVGTVAYLSFTLSNSGRGPLEWSISPHSQISAWPASGQLATNEAALVTLRVSAVGLPPGRLRTALQLVHNDPERTPVLLPVVLDVFAVRRGDTYTDNQMDTRDIVYLVNSIWKGGPDPVGDSGDLDCDHAVTLTDLMLLVNLIFKAGPPPVCGD